MFATRTNWEFSSNRLVLLHDSLKKKNEEIIDLTQSNPTECGFYYPEEEIVKALSNSSNLVYSPSSKGMLSARKIVSGYYKDKGYEVDPENIFLTSSTSEGYLFLFRLLADPGDKILFPSPSYPLFEVLTQLNDLELVPYPLKYDQWSLDKTVFDELSGGAKAIVAVNPNNPTGSFVEDDDLQIINDACSKIEASIICDEVFLDYSFEDNAKPNSLVGNKMNLTFVLGGLSKALGMPQMKLAWIVVNGPDRLVKEAKKRLEIIADTFLSVNIPSQNALEKWMQCRSVIQKDIFKRVRENKETLRSMISGNNKFKMLDAKGGWYSVLRLPGSVDEEEFCYELLREKKVFVHPGYFFDFSEGSHIVVSLLPQKRMFEEGLKAFCSQ
ncbi:MAG: pyridoxal phosphate-dependent aminotransferase [Candidatus Omnitrophica bacterium]|nr:pyridoxal phosphate-dependent aminotransferase [Candidatus Omnitrophota bacterium]MBU1996861.1 pyridoxal phosphate-dependent aminotransferase [Candidatus Omnitrophota bacterium]